LCSTWCARASSSPQRRFLRFLAERYGRRSIYRIELSKQEVAAAIATRPETLSRVLRRMEEEELLGWKDSELRISQQAWGKAGEP